MLDYGIVFLPRTQNSLLGPFTLGYPLDGEDMTGFLIYFTYRTLSPEVPSSCAFSNLTVLETLAVRCVFLELMVTLMFSKELDPLTE